MLKYKLVVGSRAESLQNLNAFYAMVLKASLPLNSFFTANLLKINSYLSVGPGANLCFALNFLNAFPSVILRLFAIIYLRMDTRVLSLKFFVESYHFVRIYRRLSM